MFPVEFYLLNKVTLTGVSVISYDFPPFPLTDKQIRLEPQHRDVLCALMSEL